jgi:hypothetical protein
MTRMSPTVAVVCWVGCHQLGCSAADHKGLCRTLTLNPLNVNAGLALGATLVFSTYSGTEMSSNSLSAFRLPNLPAGVDGAAQALTTSIRKVAW